MKIAVPSEGNTIDRSVCQSFGRTFYFAVVDSETLEYKVIDNQAVSSQGGAGIKAAQAVVDSGAGAVVTFHCGQNAADVLKAAELWVRLLMPKNAQDAVNV
jgi:predicted Fe-Mo cluster-binding NifX family protein